MSHFSQYASTPTLAATGDTVRLAQLIDARHECLRHLHELGQRQLESIDAGDFTLLMRILGGKQRLIDNLQQVERLLEPFRGQDPQTRPWTTSTERQRCATIAQASEQLLQQIVAQEKRSEQLLSAGRDRAAAQLEVANHAAQARGAYATDVAGTMSQLDLSSGR